MARQAFTFQIVPTRFRFRESGLKSPTCDAQFGLSQTNHLSINYSVGRFMSVVVLKHDFLNRDYFNENMVLRDFSHAPQDIMAVTR